MRAVVIEEYGGPEKLRLAEVPVPGVQAGEIRIRVAYAGVNPVDWKMREGRLQDIFPYEFPIIPGWDASGTVDAVGKNVETFKPGDRVYAYCRRPKVQWGTYAEFVCVEAAVAAPIPPNIGFDEAATIPLAGLTAWQALFDFARIGSHDRILIHAGAGGVGSLAIQFAKSVDALVYTTARACNHGYVKELGADVAIDYTAQSFVEVVRSAAPGGIDVVFDTVGGTVQRESYKVLRRGGVLVSIVDEPEEETARKYGVRAGYVFVAPNGEQLRQIGRLIENGTVRPLDITEMPLEDAAEAQRRSQAGHVRGKIVLRIQSSTGEGVG